MSNYNRARVCTIGTQEDMIRLCRAMLDNCDWFDERENDRPDLTLDQLIALIARYAKAESGDGATFVYDMVASRPYGDAAPGTPRMSIFRHATGLWLALFSYDSETPFQPEDWVQLHRQVRMLPMLAMYANDDFGLEKGMKLFAGGRTGDDWNRMGETWLWLMARYEEGYPPDEAVERLRKLRRTIQREDFDLTIGGILAGCIENLEELKADTSDAETLTAQMQRLRADKDYEGLFQLYLRIVETALWDMGAYDKHIACLEAVYDEWVRVEGPDD